jgi:hypothetical protein
VNEWFNSTEYNYTPFEDIIVAVFERDLTYQVPILMRLLEDYKRNKRHSAVRKVSSLFMAVNAVNLDAACKVLAKGSPMFQALYLKRKDLSARYVLRGIKALSKLTTQKDIEVEVDFTLLGKLGPVGRLQAMQQLLGMYDGYYRYYQSRQRIYGESYYTNHAKQLYEEYGRHRLPFKVMPTREEVELFLFPCSIRYNERVIKLMEKWDDLVRRVEANKQSEVEQPEQECA